MNTSVLQPCLWVPPAALHKVTPLSVRENTLHALNLRRKSGAAFTIPLVTELVRVDTLGEGHEHTP